MQLVYVFATLPLALWSLQFWWAAAFVVLLIATVVFCADDFEESLLGPYILSTLFLLSFTATFFGHSILAFASTANFGWFLFEYLTFGAGYAVFRWWWLVKQSAAKIIKNREALERQFTSDRYVGSGIKTFEDYLISIRYIPVVVQSKYRIFNWVFMWPFSLLRWTLTDLVKFIADQIVAVFGNLFTRIRDNVFRAAGIDRGLLDKPYVKPEEKTKEKVEL
jgi:hypothetical protein